MTNPFFIHIISSHYVIYVYCLPNHMFARLPKQVPNHFHSKFHFLSLVLLITMSCNRFIFILSTLSLYALGFFILSYKLCPVCPTYFFSHPSSLHSILYITPLFIQSTSIPSLHITQSFSVHSIFLFLK